MSERIIFNGKIYQNVSQMPPDVRQLYKRFETMLRDENMDGVPDIMQQGGLRGMKEAFGLIKELSKIPQSGNQWTAENMSIIRETDTSIMINGKTFRSAADMPADVRKIYQNAVRDAVPAGADIFDEPWRRRPRDSYFRPHDDEIVEPKYRTPSSESAIQHETSNFGLIIAIVLAMLLLAGIGVYYVLSSGNLF